MASNGESSEPKDIRPVFQRSLMATRQSNSALFCLTERSLIRRVAKFIVDSRAFDIFILLTIIANCIALALDVPLPNNDKSQLKDDLEICDLIFLVIFTIEAVLKIIALGFVISPGSYLRNGWNIVDFIVVVTGWISHGNFDKKAFDVKALRAVRVLRPLKLVSGTPSLQVVMKSIIRAMVPLLQILLLTFFVITIYAIIGLSFLSDKFHATCFKNGTEKVAPLGETNQPCDPKQSELLKGRTCNDGEVCREYWRGPTGGISTFDNIILAMLTVSQCITMEGWTDVMYSTFYASDNSGYVYSIFFISLIVIGSFFMLNLVLGVLSGEFAKEREKVETRRNFFKLRREQKVDRQVDNYLEWISKAEEIMVEDLVNQDQRNDVEYLQNKNIPSNFIFNPINVLAVEGGRVPRINLPERYGRFPELQLRERLLRIRVRRLVKHEGFFWAVVVVVFLNTISLATEHYDQPRWLTDFQDRAEIVFVSIFLIEMFLKIYGLGPKIYFRSTFNIFDFVVIIFGLVERIFQQSLGISVLRCLRLLKIFKMTSYWSSLRNLVKSLVSSLKSILSLMFLLFLFVVIFALLGMQFFGGRFVFDSDSEPPRTNFDDFPNAMLAVFQILTGEDWNSVMYNGIKAYGGANKPEGMIFSLYFVLLVIFGNYTLLNVFLAIAVDNLANAQILTQDENNERLERETKNEGETGSELRKSRWKDVGKFTNTLALLKSWESNTNQPTDESNIDVEGENGVNGSSSNDPNEQSKKEVNKSLMKNINKYRKELGQDDDVESQQPEARLSRREDRKISSRRHFPLSAMARNFKGRKSKVRKLKKKVPIIRTKSMFLFGPENKLRRACHCIVNLRHFDNFMLAVIVFSSVLLAIEDPLNDNSKRNKVIRYFDYICTSIFAFEVFVKVIDLGVVLHPGSYFRSKWNFIDALVVCCNITSLVLSQTESQVSGQSFLKVLRVLRVFRPLKVMNKLKKLEAVFHCMWYSFKNVANILLITALFLFMFAVIGVQLFQGKFFHCTDSSKMSKNVCKGNFFVFHKDGQSVVVKETKSREWKLRDFHFNNVFNAMLTLYTSATGEGWPNAMHHTMDVTDVNKGPIRNYSVQNAIFYITFVVVFSFFFLNIFVALVILTFQEQGEKELVNSELNRNQRDCIRFVIRAKPLERFMPKDKNTLSYKVWLVVVSKPFEFFIMALIILNTIILMMQYYGQPLHYKRTCDLLNAVLTILFMMEAALKLYAFKLSYFRDSWNVFDFIIVVGSIPDSVITFVSTSGMPVDPSMFRIFRAARVIKILRQGSGIRVLLWTFFQSFKALPYVTMLIFLVFFIYAVIGMQLFGKIKLDESTQINKYNNFQNIYQSLVLLFRSSTGENWQMIMLACNDNADCDPAAYPKEDKCGLTNWAIAYFCSFIFFCMFFMLNLFVAVIMDNFEYLTRDQSILGPHQLDEFVRIWSIYDPAAKGKIHYSKIYDMLTRLTPPVGFGKKCPKIVAYKRLIKMNMPLNEDKMIHFTTTLFALVRTSLQIRMKGNMNVNDTKLRKMISQDWPHTLDKILDKMIPKHSVLSCHQMTVGKIYCAKLICENFRQNKRRKQFELNEDESLIPQRSQSIFRRLVGSVTRSMRQRRATSPNGLVPNDTLNTQSFVDGNGTNSLRDQSSDSRSMDDVRTSSCRSSASDKTKRKFGPSSSSPLIKHAVRSTSVPYSPSLEHRKLRLSTTINLPIRSSEEIYTKNPTLDSKDYQSNFLEINGHDEPDRSGKAPNQPQQRQAEEPRQVIDRVEQREPTEESKAEGARAEGPRGEAPRAEGPRGESPRGEAPRKVTDSPQQRQPAEGPSAEGTITNMPDGKLNTDRPEPRQAEETAEPDRPQSGLFGGLLGENESSRPAEYYDKMISKINEQISLAVSRNKSPYAVYGLGSDDEDDWC